MVQIRYEKDANPALISAKKVAIIGYGSQGHAHALNLRDSGVAVRVGLHENSKSRAKAEKAGLTVDSVRNVSEWADVVMILAPDTAQPKIYEESIRGVLRPGMTLMFSHGFNVRYRTIEIPPEVDVSMIAPKSPGHRVRETYQESGGVPALLAVHQDASGEADALALSYANALGCTRAGVLTTTFAEETETDLFGEQAVLCGGVSELVKAGFKTLVDAGYQPEIAYFECLHELKLIVDLMYRGGLRYMRYSVSDTAEYGDYESGPKVIAESSRLAMQQILQEVQDGTFAKRWIDENQAGRPQFEAKRQEECDLQIEDVGARLREMMPFVEPVTIKPGE